MGAWIVMTERPRRARTPTARSDDDSTRAESAAGRDGTDPDPGPRAPQEERDESPRLVVSVDVLDVAYRDDDILMLQCIFADARRVVRRGGRLIVTGTVLGEVACTTEADILLLATAYAPGPPSTQGAG